MNPPCAKHSIGHMNLLSPIEIGGHCAKHLDSTVSQVFSHDKKITREKAREKTGESTRDLARKTISENRGSSSSEPMGTMP